MICPFKLKRGQRPDIEYRNDSIQGLLSTRDKCCLFSPLNIQANGVMIIRTTTVLSRFDFHRSLESGRIPPVKCARERNAGSFSFRFIKPVGESHIGRKF